MNRDDVLAFVDVAAKQAQEQTKDDFGVTISQLREKHFMIFAALVAAHEREECAKVCEKHVKGGSYNVRGQLAQAIRARGNHDR